MRPTWWFDDVARGQLAAWSNGSVESHRVRLMDESERPALCRMLEDSKDFPQHLLYLHRRRGGSGHATLVASCKGEIVGMLTGSFDSDFRLGGAFDSFELPLAPHAFLYSIHVNRSARRAGVGRALLRKYAEEASARGCGFIGGSVDLSNEPTSRKRSSSSADSPSAILRTSALNRTTYSA